MRSFSCFFRTNKPFARNGLANGLTLLLDVEVYDYASSTTGSEGMFLSVLHHLDIPIMKNTALSIQPGYSSVISVVPDLVNTTLGAKHRFKPKDRHCYFEDEVKLQHLIPENSFR